MKGMKLPLTWDKCRAVDTWHSQQLVYCSRCRTEYLQIRNPFNLSFNLHLCWFVLSLVIKGLYIRRFLPLLNLYSLLVILWNQEKLRHWALTKWKGWALPYSYVYIEMVRACFKHCTSLSCFLSQSNIQFSGNTYHKFQYSLTFWMLQNEKKKNPAIYVKLKLKITIIKITGRFFSPQKSQLTCFF